jgi:hypothetical protein
VRYVLEHIAKDRDFFAMSRSDARALRYLDEEALVVRDGEYFEVFFIGLDWSAVDRCSEARSPRSLASQLRQYFHQPYHLNNATIGTCWLCVPAIYFRLSSQLSVASRHGKQAPRSAISAAAWQVGQPQATLPNKENAMNTTD